MQTTTWRLSFLVIAGLLSACSTTPSTIDYSSQAEDETQLIIEDTLAWDALEPSAETLYLNDLIESPALNDLIQLGLQNNPNLQSSLLSLKIQSLTLNQTEKNNLPTVNGTLSTNKTQDQDTNYSSSIRVSWEADLWQQLALSEQVEATLYQQSEAFTQAAKDSLTANIIKNWLTVLYQQRAIDIESRRLALLQTNEQLILERFKSGLGSLEGRESAKTASERTKANLADLREDLAIAKRNMALLLGKTTLELTFNNDQYPNVINPLQALPMQNMQGRPDLKAAYLDIKANDLSISVAYKDLLPSISLQASLQSSGTSPRDTLFISPIWSLLGQLTVPILQRGEIETRVEIAKLKTAQSYQAYRDTLLNAVIDVENTLGQERVLEQRQQFTQNALTSAQANLQQYQNKYRTGLATLNELVNVQQETYDLEANLDALLYQRLSNRIDLGLALGLSAEPTVGENP